jgi:polyhydroxyalkanoate synthesis repressor PhaR
MNRVITRYGGGSRKLYDTTDSRYISLDDIPAIIRTGDALRVVDSVTGADVTGQVLAQVISNGERRGVSFLSADAMQEIIRGGERLIVDGVRTLQLEMDRWLGPRQGRRVPGTRNELQLLRRGLQQLEQSLAAVGRGVPRHHARRHRRRVRSAGAGSPHIRTHREAS